jgi:hypothetical protein
MNVQNTPMVASKSLKLTLSAAKGSVEHEVSTYHEWYPELRNFIWTQVLNRYPCVILPYFLPIPKGEWLNSIESIKDILKKFKVGNY